MLVVEVMAVQEAMVEEWCYFLQHHWRAVARLQQMAQMVKMATIAMVQHLPAAAVVALVAQFIL
jgi:hypothetical protein